MLTPTVVRNTRFTMTQLRPGYQPREVDAFLDRIGAGLDRLTREPAASIPPPSGATLKTGPMTPADVRNAHFTLTRPGYEPMEVDAFLDRIEDELDRLTRENDKIRAQFAETRYGAGSPRPWVPPVLPAGPGPRRANRSEFGCMLVLALFFAAAAIAFGFVVAASHSAYQRSNYTQANGIPDSAIVTGERVVTGKAAETYVTVRLETPVGGRDVSVVNIAGAHSYQPGDKIAILVDPRDPSYSELPGRPDEVALETLVITAIGGVLMTLAVAGSLVVAFRARPSRPPRPNLPS